VTTSTRAIVSLVRANGELEVAIRSQPVPTPADDEVLIRVVAAPVNPADIKLLFGGLSAEDLTVVDETVQAKLSSAQLLALSGRLDVPLPVGNEGAGLVVAAGAASAAQALLHRYVSVAAGGMFSDYRVARAADCIMLPADVSAAQGAAGWINPLTALAMVETMQREGHHALVLTAAASNLGQMLNRLCQADAIPLVNVVRSAAQVDLLRSLGAAHVCNSSDPDFDAQLVDALAATGATLAFDATGGGALAGRILRAMERALVRSGQGYSRYGSTTLKQLYFFGGLDPSPVVFERDFGMAWAMGGWLLQPRLATFGADRVAAFKRRVAADLLTIFKADVDGIMPLSGLLSPAHFTTFMQLKTGGKMLVSPALG
jgi:NADPH:quinone reductase-like Zn-dependent oxidoreductase